METYVEPLTESMTEQRFLEDVDYDDAALEEMLYNAHREHVYHSHRKHEFQADYDGRSIQKLNETIESQKEELHRAQAEELQRRDQHFFMHSYCSITGNHVKLVLKVSMKWKN